MARGLAYDSDEGRAYAAAITALMTGRAYRKSSEIAKRMGPFAGYRPNAAAMIGVIAKHRAAVGNIANAETVPADLLGAARKAWDDALDLGEVYGYRNAQATVLAPTGTISFMMDCDTTGVEPDFSLVKSKKLVGGGEITIVNKTVPLGLEKLGYAPNEIDEIVAFIDERNTVVGAPYVKSEHYPVFDCAVGERAIHYRGHVKMMGAIQPFISGAISKTVNLPETATIDEVAQLYRRRVEARREGDRDLPRQLQGRAAALRQERQEPAGARARRRHRRAEAPPPAGRPQRDRPQVPRRRVRGLHPRRRVRRRHRPGDIFVDIAKDGTTLAGPDELADDRGLDGPAVRRAARGVRLEAVAPALRAVGSHERRRHPRRRSRSSTTSSAGSGRSSSTSTSRRRRASSRSRSAPRWPSGIANGEPAARRDARRRARPRSSTRTKTRSSATAAAAAWCAPAPVTRAATAARAPAAVEARRASRGVTRRHEMSWFRGGCRSSPSLLWTLTAAALQQRQQRYDCRMAEFKRRLRLLLERLNFSDPSRTTPFDDQLHVGEGAIHDTNVNGGP